MKITKRITLFAALALLTGCNATPLNTAMKTAADVQAKAADGYDAASKEERAAIVACKAKADAAAVVLPPPSASVEIDAACGRLGAPLPYPLAKLRALRTPINALHESLQIAYAAMNAKAGDVLGLVIDVSTHLALLAKDVGILGAKAPPGAAIDTAAAKLAAVTGGAR